MSIVDNHQEGLEVKEEGSKVNVTFKSTSESDNHAVQASWLLDGTGDAIYYYEVVVKSAEDAVGVGLAQAGFATVGMMPGWVPGSYAYHGDDGNRFNEGQAQAGWPTFGADAVVGMGLKVATGEIFGTLDGKFLGVVATIKSKEPLLPTIGFNASGEVVVLFDKKDHKFALSSLPESLVPVFGSLEDTDRSSSKLVVLLTNGADEQRAHLEGQLEGAAKIAKSQYGFQSLFTKETKGAAAGIRAFVGIHDRTPLLVAINVDENTKFAIPEGEPITTESILKLVEEVSANKLTSLKRSAPRPPNDKHPSCATLVQVVGASFDEVVMGGDKDVLLDVYADFCGPCRTMAPTLELLSEVFADNNNIVVAKLDCETNDVDRTSANKKEPIKYKGNRTLEDFIQFLHTNATVKFDLEAVEERAKEMKQLSEKKALKNVVSIHKAEDFKEQLASDKLVIVDFTAVWCGPCRAIAPVFAGLSEEFSDAVFLKVDVDELKEVAKEQGVTCMPTFKAYKKGVEVGKLEGADPKGLKKLVVDNM